MSIRLFFIISSVFLSLTALSLNTFSQESVIGLTSFIEVIKVEAQLTEIKAFSVKTGKSKIINIKDLTPVIDGYIVNFSKTAANKNFKEGQLLARNRNLIKQYFDGIYSFAGAGQNVYYDLKSKIEDVNSLPIGFAQFNNNLLFYQTNIFYDKIINNLKLSADERAFLIAKECVIPSLGNFKPLLGNIGIKYFSLVYSYVSKDFMSDEIPNADGETMTIIISRDLLKKYINLEATPEDVYKGSTFYNSNKNTNGTLRKITIK